MTKKNNAIFIVLIIVGILILYNLETGIPREGIVEKTGKNVFEPGSTHTFEISIQLSKPSDSDCSDNECKVLEGIWSIVTKDASTIKREGDWKRIDESTSWKYAISESVKVPDEEGQYILIALVTETEMTKEAGEWIKGDENIVTKEAFTFTVSKGGVAANLYLNKIVPQSTTAAPGTKLAVTVEVENKGTAYGEKYVEVALVAKGKEGDYPLPRSATTRAGFTTNPDSCYKESFVAKGQFKLDKGKKETATLTLTVPGKDAKFANNQPNYNADGDYVLIGYLFDCCSNDPTCTKVGADASIYIPIKVTTTPSNLPNIELITDPVIYADGSQIVATVTIKNTGVSMTESYLVELQATTGEFQAVIPPEQETCKPNEPKNVHINFKLAKDEQKTITLVSPQTNALADGTYKAGIYFRTKCAVDQPDDKSCPLTFNTLDNINKCRQVPGLELKLYGLKEGIKIGATGDCRAKDSSCDLIQGGGDKLGIENDHELSSQCSTGFCWDSLGTGGHCETPICCKSSSTYLIWNEDQCITGYTKVDNLDECKDVKTVEGTPLTKENLKAVIDACGGTTCAKEADPCDSKLCCLNQGLECQGESGSKKCIKTSNVTKGTATQVSLREKDLTETTSATIVKAICKVDENCLPYESIEETNIEYTVKCKKTALLQQKIDEAVDEECSVISWNYFKILLGGNIAACALASLIAVPLGPSGVVTSLVIGCLLAPVASIGITGGALAYEGGCQLATLSGDNGLCIASPVGGADICQYFTWAGKILPTGAQDYSCAVGIAIIIIGILLILYIFKQK